MTTRIVVLACVLVMLWPIPAAAFNGHRAGFVLGGGLGFSPEARWENNDIAGIDDQGVGPAFDVLIGYGWNDNNLLVWDIDAAYVKGDVYERPSSVLQGFGGPAWYRYFGEPGRAIYLTVGAGITRFVYCPDDEDDCHSFNWGPAYRVGAGYEFARHFQAGATVSFGASYDGNANTYLHTTLNVLVCGVLF